MLKILNIECIKFKWRLPLTYLIQKWEEEKGKTSEREIKWPSSRVVRKLVLKTMDLDFFNF